MYIICIIYLYIYLDDLANVYNRERKLFTTTTQKNWKEIEKDVKLTLTLPLLWKGILFNVYISYIIIVEYYFLIYISIY